MDMVQVLLMRTVHAQQCLDRGCLLDLSSEYCWMGTVSLANGEDMERATLFKSESTCDGTAQL